MLSTRVLRTLIRHAIPLASAALAQAGVHVVAPSGGDFANPQDAVNASSDGDVVLVRTGSYFLPLDISSKSLTVTADAGAVVDLAGSVAIGGLSSAQFVTLQGLRMHTLTVSGCTGPVRIVGCSTPLTVHNLISLPQGGTYVVASANVVFSGCDLNGVTTTSVAYHNPLPGVLLQDSTVLITDSHTRGGDGPDGAFQIPGLPGASAIESANSVLYLSGATCQGGAGGRGWDGVCGSPTNVPTNGGAGALAVSSIQASPTVLDSTLTGGTGGIGGSNACASAPNGPNGAPFYAATPPQFIAGVHRILSPIQPAREGGSLAVHFRGLPGDRVFLSSSAIPSFSYQPILHGVLLVSPPYRRRQIGIADASGLLDVLLPVSELGAGVQGAVLQMQIVAVDPVGERWLTGIAPATRLDSSF